jgi:nicotinamidase-related amidase
VDDFSPGDEDTVVEGKRGLVIVASTNLDFIPRSKDIHTVALGGFLTNCCVESTMRSATSAGYDVVTLTDCVLSPLPGGVRQRNRLRLPRCCPTHPAAGASRTNRLGTLGALEHFVG